MVGYTEVEQMRHSGRYTAFPEAGPVGPVSAAHSTRCHFTTTIAGAWQESHLRLTRFFVKQTPGLLDLRMA